jgi:hypothetical protein
LSSRMLRGESIPSLSDGRAASAYCRTGCSDCWSYYSAKSFPILKMQSRLQHPLEIVLTTVSPLVQLHVSPADS